MDYWDAQCFPFKYPTRDLTLGETQPELYRGKNSIEVCEIALRGKLWLEPEHVDVTDVFGFLPIFNARVRVILAMAIDPTDLEFMRDPANEIIGEPSFSRITAQYFGMGLKPLSTTTSTVPELSRTWKLNPVNEFKWPDNVPFDESRFETGEIPANRTRFKTLYDTVVELKNGAPNTGLEVVAESPGAIYPGDTKHIDYCAQTSIKVQFKPSGETYCPTEYGQLFWIVCSEWIGGAQTDGSLEIPPPPEGGGGTSLQFTSELRPRYDIVWTFKFKELTYGRGACGQALCYTDKPMRSKPEIEQDDKTRRADIFVDPTSTSVLVDDTQTPSGDTQILNDREVYVSAASNGEGAKIWVRKKYTKKKKIKETQMTPDIPLLKGTIPIEETSEYFQNFVPAPKYQAEKSSRKRTENPMGYSGGKGARYE